MKELNDSDTCIEDILSTLVAEGMFFGSVKNIDTLKDICTKLGIFEKHPDADPNTYFTDITSDSSNLSYEDGRDALPLHTDGSASKKPPNILVSYCVAPAEEGGISIFSDSYKTLRYLKKHNQEALSALYTKKVIFGNPALTQHQTSIVTLEEQAPHIRFRSDGFMFYPETLTQVVHETEEILNKFIIQKRLQKGEVYFVDNTRVLHGRSAFTGDQRHIKRLLVHSTLLTERQTYDEKEL